VISDIVGVSGRRMIEAMIAGVRNPHRLAELAHRGIKASPKELYDALHGRLTEHHRFPLQLHLAQWGALDAAIQQIDQEVDGRIERVVQCAWAAKRQKNSYYMAQFQRLKSRRWRQKAICAVAAFILTAIYHMLKNRVPHHDLGADYFDRRSPETNVRRLVAQLSRLGFEAKLQPLAQAA
jgi:hypothetical protein